MVRSDSSAAQLGIRVDMSLFFYESVWRGRYAGRGRQG